jgi:hypothetical protein
MLRRIQISLILIVPTLLSVLLITARPAQAGGVAGSNTPGSRTEATLTSYGSIVNRPGPRSTPS